MESSDEVMANVEPRRVVTINSCHWWDTECCVAEYISVTRAVERSDGDGLVGQRAINKEAQCSTVLVARATRGHQMARDVRALEEQRVQTTSATAKRGIKRGRTCAREVLWCVFIVAGVVVDADVAESFHGIDAYAGGIRNIQARKGDNKRI